VATWQAIRSKDPAAVAHLVQLGREDREHAERVTNAILEMIATMQKAVAA
jgi:hypothetical protein